MTASGPMVYIGVSLTWSSITECALFHEHITEALEEIWMDRDGNFALNFAKVLD